MNVRADAGDAATTRPRAFVVLDFEAVTPTGSRPVPIEIAAMLITGDLDEPGQVLVDELIALDDPNLLTAFDVRQTGITREMLASACSARSVLNQLDESVPEAAILVAHNASFERNVLTGHPDCPPRLRGVQFADTLRLARGLLRDGGRHDLDSLARRLDVEIPADRHRALPDVRMTCTVFHRLIELAFRRQPDMSWHDLLARMLLPVRPSTPSAPDQPRLFDI